MKAMTIVGAMLIVAGLFIVFNGVSFTKEKTIFKAGPIEANVNQQHSVPTWAGALSIVAGIGCVVAGLRKP